MPASIYYKKTSTTCYYTNENKSGYSLFTPVSINHATMASHLTLIQNNSPVYGRNVVIELYNDKFILPEESKGIFYGATNTTFNDMDKWDFSEVKLLIGLFQGTRIREFDITNLPNGDTSGVTSMAHMLATSALKRINLTGLNTSNVTDMFNMFSITEVTELDLSPLDTSNVTDMGTMFSGMYYLNELDVSPLDTSKVTNMKEMFRNCDVEELDLSTFDTSNVRSFEEMFYTTSTTKLKKINITGGDLSSVEPNGLRRMFDGQNLEQILADEETDWELQYPGISTTDNIFVTTPKLPNYVSTERTIAKANNTKGGYFGDGHSWKVSTVFMKGADWLEYEVWFKKDDAWSQQEVYR